MTDPIAVDIGTKPTLGAKPAVPLPATTKPADKSDLPNTEAPRRGLFGILGAFLGSFVTGKQAVIGASAALSLMAGIAGVWLMAPTEEAANNTTAKASLPLAAEPKARAEAETEKPTGGMIPAQGLAISPVTTPPGAVSIPPAPTEPFRRPVAAVERPGSGWATQDSRRGTEHDPALRSPGAAPLPPPDAHLSGPVAPPMFGVVPASGMSDPPVLPPIPTGPTNVLPAQPMVPPLPLPDLPNPALVPSPGSLNLTLPSIPAGVTPLPAPSLPEAAIKKPEPPAHHTDMNAQAPMPKEASVPIAGHPIESPLVPPPSLVPVPDTTPKPPAPPPAIAPLPATPEFKPVGAGPKIESPKPAESTNVTPVAAVVKQPTTSYDVDIYTAKASDNWQTISREFYSDVRYAAALEAYNKKMNLTLQVGKDVDVPPLHIVKGLMPSPPPSPPAPPGGAAPEWGTAGSTGVARTGSEKMYRVPTGGLSLQAVARLTLGTDQRWSEIYDLNPHVNPSKVPGGTELKLPTDARWTE